MDTGFLKPLYSAQGHVVSVYIDTERTTPQAGREIAARWKRTGKRLHADGADEATLAAIETAVGSDRGRPAPWGQAIFGADGRVLLTEELRHAPSEQDSEVSTLPHTLPLLAQRSGRSAWILAFAARTGADFEVWGPSGRIDTQRFDGEAQAAHKAGTAEPGEWRRQRDAEEVWEANARQAAEHLTGLAHRHGADLIVVAGDVHGRSLLVKHLGAAWQDRAVMLPERTQGSRAAGADRDRQREAAESVAAELENEARAGEVERYRQALAGGGAVEGLAEVVEAVRRGEVDTLLLRHQAAALDVPLWWGAEPGQLAADPGELSAVRPAEVRRDPAGEVLVRAVAQFDGRVLVTSGGEPGPSGDGVGALLRHA
ncbi:MAG TPA: hypothetical protein VGM10_20165 [Actinocrinis sp.]|jgi:hypothetical protein